MSVRYRRRRLFFIAAITVIYIIYYVNSPKETNVSSGNESSNQQLKDEVKRAIGHENRGIVKKTEVIGAESHTRREEIVEIDGKKLRKIDWHDYEGIRRDNARQGKRFFMV